MVPNISREGRVFTELWFQGFFFQLTLSLLANIQDPFVHKFFLTFLHATSRIMHHPVGAPAPHWPNKTSIIILFLAVQYLYAFNSTASYLTLFTPLNTSLLLHPTPQPPQPTTLHHHHLQYYHAFSTLSTIFLWSTATNRCLTVNVKANLKGVQHQRECWKQVDYIPVITWRMHSSRAHPDVIPLPHSIASRAPLQMQTP